MPTYQRIPAAAASGNEAILPLRIIILPAVDAKLSRLTARHITVPTMTTANVQRLPFRWAEKMLKTARKQNAAHSNVNTDYQKRDLLIEGLFYFSIITYLFFRKSGI